MGLRYLATHQSDKITLERISKGVCYLAELDEKVIGTATLYLPETMKGTPWYEQEKVAIVGQFAVEPDYQKLGIGKLLMDEVEDEVLARNIPELALDTSEDALHLIAYYTRRGYRFIEHVKWPDANYRSVILSKTL
jgi:GNAT superfamily N-acetyltransferase